MLRGLLILLHSPLQGLNKTCSKAALEHVDPLPSVLDSFPERQSPRTLSDRHTEEAIRICQPAHHPNIEHLRPEARNIAPDAATALDVDEHGLLGRPSR